MFFILSKLLIFLIQPLNWIMGLLLFSLFSKVRARKRKSLIAAILLLVFFTNHFTFNQIVRWWEPESITADQIDTPYDIGILLGGFTNFEIRPNHDRYNFHRTANRFTQTLELYKKGKIKKIFITGGNGAILGDQTSEAPAIREFLLLVGVPDSNIIIEGQSRNTYENALYTKEILDREHPNANCLLITSAWHMPRSQRCFAKAGIPFTPYCVDYFSEKTRFKPASLFIPNRDCLYRWEALIKEWFGLMAYKLRGYI